VGADNIISSTVELGGKSPNIYFADVLKQEPDFISKCVEGAVLAFFNQGEVCTCPSRLLIQEEILGPVVSVATFVRWFRQTQQSSAPMRGISPMVS
jgi:aldehyde dehydrogenase